MVIPLNPDPLLSKGSISEMAAFISKSRSLLNNVWPVNPFNILCPLSFIGFPSNISATQTLLLTYFANEGFTNLSSKLIIFGVIPYRTLNKILNDSSVPFVWYNDLASPINVPTSKLDWKSVSSKPGKNVFLNFL